MLLSARHAPRLASGTVDQQAVAIPIKPCPMQQTFVSLPLPLAIQPGIRIASRSIGLVRPLLAMAAGFRAAPAAISQRFARATLRLNTLHRVPCLINVLSTEKWSVDRSFFTLGWISTAVRNIATMSPFEQPIAVLGEPRMIPGVVVNADTDKPTKQKVVLQTFRQKPFRAVNKTSATAASPAGCCIPVVLPSPSESLQSQ